MLTSDFRHVDMRNMHVPLPSTRGHPVVSNLPLHRAMQQRCCPKDCDSPQVVLRVYFAENKGSADREAEKESQTGRETEREREKQGKSRRERECEKERKRRRDTTATANSVPCVASGTALAQTLEGCAFCAEVARRRKSTEEKK